MLYADDESYRNDVWKSNDLGASWQLSTSDADWTPRGQMSAVSIEETIVLMGGKGKYIFVHVIYLLTKTYIANYDFI